MQINDQNMRVIEWTLRCAYHGGVPWLGNVRGMPATSEIAIPRIDLEDDNLQRRALQIDAAAMGAAARAAGSTDTLGALGYDERREVYLFGRVGIDTCCAKRNPSTGAYCVNYKGHAYHDAQGVAHGEHDNGAGETWCDPDKAYRSLHELRHERGGYWPQ
jgi:hypothetical protein